MSKPIVYTKTLCRFCPIVKQFLDDKGVDYELRNIDGNNEYRNEVLEMGYQSVPLVVVEKDGLTDVVVGFDVAKLNKLFS